MKYFRSTYEYIKNKLAQVMAILARAFNETRDPTDFS